MPKLTEMWEGEFGDKYTERNSLTDENINQRYNFWAPIVFNVSAISVPTSWLEFGAGSGGNLVAIDKFYIAANSRVELNAVEINQKARNNLLAHGFKNFKLYESMSEIKDGAVDVAFTFGVLIHLSEPELTKIINDIYRVSKKWLIICEYFAPKEEMIEYKGQKDLMWRRDYGSLFLDKFKMRVLACGFAWKRITGLDNVTFWVFEKVN